MVLTGGYGGHVSYGSRVDSLLYIMVSRATL